MSARAPAETFFISISPFWAASGHHSARWGFANAKRYHKALKTGMPFSFEAPVFLHRSYRPGSARTTPRQGGHFCDKENRASKAGGAGKKRETMKRQHETRMLLFLMTGTAILFFAAAVPLSGFGFFLLAQVAGLVLGGITLVSLFRRYRGLDLFSAASIYVLYVLMIALFSPGVVNALARYLTK